MTMDDEPGSGSPLYIYEGSSAYGNTVRVSSVAVLDELGNLSPFARIESASGIDYAAIPEPGTSGVIGLGLLILAALRVTRRRV